MVIVPRLGAILGYGFANLGLNRICAIHLARNPASGRVMQKVGMTREGLCPQHVKKWDRYEDLVLYGILKATWQGELKDSEGFGT